MAELIQYHDETIRNGTPSEDTLLNWILDNSTEKERTVPQVAAGQFALALASIHTTVFSTANVIFDLSARPKWISVLPVREEIDHVIKSFGKPGDSSLRTDIWLQKLEKLDSFIVESQRINQPVLHKLTSPPLRANRWDTDQMFCKSIHKG